MINWQETLLFPVRDGESRKQFLIACLVMLAGFIIYPIPTFVSSRLESAPLENHATA